MSDMVALPGYNTLGMKHLKDRNSRFWSMGWWEGLWTPAWKRSKFQRRSDSKPKARRTTTQKSLASFSRRRKPSQTLQICWVLSQLYHCSDCSFHIPLWAAHQWPQFWGIWTPSCVWFWEQCAMACCFFNGWNNVKQRHHVSWLIKKTHPRQPWGKVTYNNMGCFYKSFGKCLGFTWSGDRTSGWLMLKELLCWWVFRLHTALQYLKKAQKIEEKLEAQYSKAGLRGFLLGSELVQGLMGDAKIQQAVKVDSWVQNFLRSLCSCLIAVWGTHLNLCALLSQMGKHQEAQGSVQRPHAVGGLSKRIWSRKSGAATCWQSLEEAGGLTWIYNL